MGNAQQADSEVVASSTQSGPNYAFIDPTAEDTMIVQYILTSRMGSRELEDSEDESELPKAEVKEEVKADKDEKEEESSKNEEKKEDSPEEIKDLKDIKKQETDAKPEVKETKPDSGSVSENGSPTKAVAKDGKKDAKMISVEEYLVKFRNFSYLHCQWLTEQELTRGDKRINQKIKRFQQKREKSGNVLDFCDEEPFNPDYVEVDRVLDASEHTDEQTKVTTKHYLVKWRSLPCEDCTWELEADVDPKKIEDFKRWRDPPAEEDWAGIER